MSLSDVLSKHGDAVRSVTGLSSKLSIPDMTKYISELVRVNLLHDTSAIDKEINVDDGTWDSELCTIQLDKGIYTFSVELYNNTSTPITLRVENRTGKARGASTNSSDTSWGVAPTEWLNSSQRKIINMTFEVYQPGSILLGFSGNPFKQGSIKYSKAMLNTGTLPLPYTQNTLGGVIPPNLFDIARMELAKTNREGTIFTFEDNSNPNGSVYTDFLVQNNIPLKKNTAYQLSFSIRGTGTIVTYVYGNNSFGKYIDNGHRWGLTNQWQEFQQYLPPESVPLNANFNFRSVTNCSGEVTNLKLTPVE